MIKLNRIRTASAVPAGLRGEPRIEKILLLLAGRRANELKFESRFWKDAKPQLKLESAGKCAYCEAFTSVVAHGDVEHFRPKSRYWWLAYCYDNYLYACQICNQVYKGDEFPVSGPRLQEPPLPPEDLADADVRTVVAHFAPDPLDDPRALPLADHLQALLDEQADLPDPYLIDPEPFFKWVADPVLKEVVIAPRDASAFRVYDAAVKYYGLNREDLRRVRWRIFRDLRAFRKVLTSGQFDLETREEVVEAIRAMMAGDAEFAGMVRYFVSDEWHLDLV
jgi:hypothetical protein